MYMLMLETVKHVTITYNLGNLASWISAAGTFTAVLTSLYLANRQSRPHIWLDFVGDNYRDCRITNKSFRPVELKLRLPGENHYEYFPLPPMKDQIQDLRDDQAFQKDHITFSFSSEDKTILSARGFDIVTMSKYYFAFYKDKDKWIIKQFKHFVTWKLYLYWRESDEGL